MYVSELMKSTAEEQNDENLWFPTPESPGNEKEHTPKPQRILRGIREHIKKEKLYPTKDQKSRKTLLDMFQCESSKIEENDKKQLKKTIVEYSNIFALHRLDMTGINNSFKVKLTSKDERPIYTQSLPVTMNLKKNSRIGPNAQVWHNNDVWHDNILKTRKSDFYTTQTRWRIVYLSTCGK